MHYEAGSAPLWLAVVEFHFGTTIFVKWQKHLCHEHGPKCWIWTHGFKISTASFSPALARPACPPLLPPTPVCTAGITLILSHLPPC